MGRFLAEEPLSWAIGSVVLAFTVAGCLNVDDELVGPERSTERPADRSDLFGGPGGYVPDGGGAGSPPPVGGHSDPMHVGGSADETSLHDPMPSLGGTGSETGLQSDCSPSSCSFLEVCTETASGALCTPLGNPCPGPDSCSAGQGYIGCGCVDRVSGPGGYALAGLYSYINRIFLPGPDDPPCCFNLNPDEPGPDNALGGLLGLLGPLLGDDLDINGILEDTLIDDDLTRVIEFRGLSPNLQSDAPVFGLSIWDARYAGDDLDDFEASWLNGRLAGNGMFRLRRSSLGAFGAHSQFNNASIENGVITAGPSTIWTELRMPGLDGASEIVVEIEHEAAILEIPVRSQPNGLVTDTMPSYGTWIGTGKLGGVIDFGVIAAIVDDLMRDCTCAGINPSRTVFRAGEVGGQYVVECAQTIEDGCTGDDGFICDFLPTFCTTLPSVFSGNDALIDVDSTGSGVRNAMSVGLWLGLTGARIDPVQPWVD